MGPWSLSVLFTLATLATLAAAVVAWRVRARLTGRRVRLLRPPGRAMGVLERTFDLLHHIGGFVIVLVAKIEGDVDLGVLRRALDTLQAKHPLLQVHVSGPDGLFRSEGTQPIPLVPVVRQSAEQWRDVVLEELEHPLPYGPNPLLKLTWLHTPGVSAELILTANHAVVDGVSGAVILRDLLGACAEGAPAVSAALLARSAVPPLDAGIGRSGELARPKEPRPALLLPATPTKVSDRHPVVVTEQIAPHAMSTMLQRCREKKTTFHGLLCASSLFAIAVEFGAARELSLSSNVSIRNELVPPVSAETIGCFIGGVTTAHGIAADAELWATARSVREAIARYVAERSHLRWLGGGLTWLQELGLRHLLAKFNDGRINVVNVSNSGKFEIPSTYGALHIAELYFLSSQHIIGSTLQISVVSLAETLFLTFSWARPLLSDEQASRIIATLRRTLDLAAANEAVTLAALSPRNPPSPTRKRL